MTKPEVGSYNDNGLVMSSFAFLQLMQALEDFLTAQLTCEGEDTVIPAVLLLYSLNKKPVREVSELLLTAVWMRKLFPLAPIKAAVETIGKYLQNIIENPDEPKYRRIRMSNKVFQVG